MQKKLIKYVLGAALLCASFFGTWQGFVHFKDHKKSRTAQKGLPLAEKPFVVVIPSYNNEPFCEKNLRSVFEQKYKNFRVIYIDDSSTDKTFERVQNLVKQCDEVARVTLIKNPVNRGSLANYYHAIHSCQDNEIVVALDGDDFLAHDGVLAKLNRAYANENVWMTYGNYLDYPTYKQSSVVPCKKISDGIIRKNSYRKEPWTALHLRTFYAGLFKKVHLEDLLYQGKFYPMTGDLAMMYPLLEMAGKHARFIPDVLYLYNRTNPINDHKVNLTLQQACEGTIRKTLPYLPLEKLSHEEKAEKTHLVIFSYNRPLQLYALLESTQKWVQGVEKTSVLYRASPGDFARGYEEIQKNFPEVHFFRQSDLPEKDFQPLLFEILFRDESCPYLLFAVDDILVKDPVDLRTCIRSMEKTNAYGFYLAHGLHLDYCFMQNCAQEIPPHVSLDENTFGWQFKTGKADWNYPNSLDMVLYRKEDVEKDLKTLTFHNPNTLEDKWAKIQKKKRVGLFFDRSRTLNIPLNLVNLSSNRHMNAYSTEELLEKFKAGLKIDLEPFLHVENRSKHHEADVHFVKR